MSSSSQKATSQEFSGLNSHQDDASQDQGNRTHVGRLRRKPAILYGCGGLLFSRGKSKEHKMTSM